MKKIYFDAGNKITGMSQNLKFVERFDQINFDEVEKKFFLDISKGKNHNYKLSECSKESGESALDVFKLSIRFSKRK